MNMPRVFGFKISETKFKLHGKLNLLNKPMLKSSLRDCKDSQFKECRLSISLLMSNWIYYYSVNPTVDILPLPQGHEQIFWNGIILKQIEAHVYKHFHI